MALLLAASVVGLTVQGVLSADADAYGPVQSQVVSAVPSTATPDIQNGIVYSITQVGTRMIVGGSFTSVAPHGSTAAITRNYVFAFDAATGTIDTGFHPAVNGVIESVIPGPWANTAYLGGYFTTVNGAAQRGVVMVSTITGAVIAPFKSSITDGVVFTLRYAGGRLFVGGSFTKVGGAVHGGLATLNRSNGQVDKYMNVQLTGHHNWDGSGAYGVVGPRAMDISADGKHLVVIGNFKKANGVVHDQILQIDLGTTAAAIHTTWNTSGFAPACGAGNFDSYVRDVAFSPDGSYFVVAATGGHAYGVGITQTLCDSATRWATAATGTNVTPTWVDYTGNDTLLSVATTQTAIYVGGHERWLNNPNGSDRAGAGAVPRPGVAALDPSNGLPLAWNPGRNPRGSGAWAIYASSTGVYYGSDTTNYGDHEQYHAARIAFFPLAGGATPAATTTSSLPGNIFLAGSTGTEAAATDLAVRSMSGTTIGAVDTVPNTGIDWSTTRSAFVVGSTIYYGTVDGTFHRASFNGSTVGTPVTIDPYDDPNWADRADRLRPDLPRRRDRLLQPAHQRHRRLLLRRPALLLPQRRETLYYRYFTPDSGIIGGTQFTATGGDFSAAAGMFLSGTSLYYVNATTGNLYRIAFSGGVRLRHGRARQRAVARRAGLARTQPVRLRPSERAERHAHRVGHRELQFRDLLLRRHRVHRLRRHGDRLRLELRGRHDRLRRDRDAHLRDERHLPGHADRRGQPGRVQHALDQLAHRDRPDLSDDRLRRSCGEHGHARGDRDHPVDLGDRARGHRGRRHGGPDRHGQRERHHRHPGGRVERLDRAGPADLTHAGDHGLHAHRVGGGFRSGRRRAAVGLGERERAAGRLPRCRGDHRRDRGRRVHGDPRDAVRVGLHHRLLGAVLLGRPVLDHDAVDAALDRDLPRRRDRRRRRPGEQRPRRQRSGRQRRHHARAVGDGGRSQRAWLDRHPRDQPGRPQLRCGSALHCDSI